MGNNKYFVRFFIINLFVIFSCVIVSNAMAQDEHQKILANKFQEKLDQIARDLPGVMGISVIDLNNKQKFGVNEKLTFPQGSAIKVPLLISLYIRAERGELDLKEAVPILAKDRVGGSGYISHFGDGTSSLSLHDLAVMMITVSDNMATNILIDKVGMDNVTKIMKDLGFANTKLQRKMIRQMESVKGNENLSTPLEAASIMEKIYHCDLPISENACKEMQDIMAIPHEGAIATGTPPGIRVLQKTGSIDGVYTSWGAVDLEGRPYTLAAMGNYGDTDEAREALIEIARACHWYFSRLSGATKYGTRVPPEFLEESR
ncbi:MAG: serine hydrolase [Emcibacteraceae bacterium]